jgi:DUF3017 family protein
VTDSRAVSASGPVEPVIDDRPPIRGGWVGRQWPLLLVLGGSLTAFLTVALDHFRAGCLLFGFSVLFAALARAVLPARRVGLLVVRSRAFDLLVLLVMGISLVVLAIIVPRPS